MHTSAATPQKFFRKKTSFLGCLQILRSIFSLAENGKYAYVMRGH